MLLNSYKPETINYDIYNLDETAISNVSKLFTINKRDSVVELQDYIDNMIVYFDKKSVMIRNISRNEHSRFNNYMSAIKKKCASGKLKTEITLRVPNDLYSKIPVMHKLPIPFDEDAKWKKLKGDIHNYINPNSPLYCKIIKDITHGAVKNPVGIPLIKLYKEVRCNTNEDVLKAINSFFYPKFDIDGILQYIESVINELKVLKYASIETMPGSNSVSFNKLVNDCFNYVEYSCTCYKYCINMLLQLYSKKIDVIYSTITKKEIEIGTLTESLMNHKALYEMNYYINEGINPMDMMDKVNTEVVKEMDDSLNYICEYITNIYEKMKKSLTVDYQDKFMLDYFRFDNNDLDKLRKNIEDISDEECTRLVNRFTKFDYMQVTTPIDFTNTENIIIDNIEEINHIINRSFELIINEIDTLKSDIMKDNTMSSYSIIFNRYYNCMGLFIKTDIDILRGQLMNDPYMRDYIIPKDMDGVIINGALNPKGFGYMHHELINNNKLELANLLSRYYNTLSVSFNYFNQIYDFDKIKCVDNCPIQLTERLLAYIIDFQYKCSLLDI